MITYARIALGLIQLAKMFADWSRSQADFKAGEDAAFMAAKAATARFYAEHILSKVPGVRDSILEGHAAVTEMALEAF